MKKNLVIFLIIIIEIAVLSLTFYAGVLLQSEKTASQSRLEITKLVEALNSKVFPSIVASGEVTNISGRTITITREGANLAIPISEGAEIASFGPVFNTGENITPLKKKLDFADIKVGNSISIILKLSPGGELYGTSVSIFPKLD